MDVSNSTGEDTGYRVVGGGQARRAGRGGAQVKMETLHEGTLRPNTYVTLPVSVPTFEVHFHRDGVVFAKQKAPEGNSGDLLVALVAKGKSAPKPFICRKKA